MINYQQFKQDYIHKIDKKQIPVCNIMGVNIAAVNMEWLLDFTTKNIKNLSGDYMCVSNVHTTVTAFKNKDYQKTQNGGAIAIPDGGPLSSIGQKRGYKTMERIAGPSYMEEILKRSMQNHWKHYFYGSTEDTLRKLETSLKNKYPDLQIVGMYSPPFRETSESEDTLIVKNINTSEADFVWIGLGAPKQEIWMAAHQGKIKGFMIGIGAGFDYLSGNIKRAPTWMQENNLEWFYRLMQDPGRLFTRYLYTNLKFIWHAYLRGE